MAVVILAGTAVTVGKGAWDAIYPKPVAVPVLPPPQQAGPPRSAPVPANPAVSIGRDMTGGQVCVGSKCTQTPPSGKPH